MSLDDFDPNGKKPKAPLFASYIPTRRPEFKTHSALGHAKNAVGNRYPEYEGIVYRFVDGEWLEEDRYEIPKVCQRCDEDFSKGMGKLHWYGRYHSLSLYPFRKDIVSYKHPVVCYKCHEEFAYADHLKREEIQAELVEKLGL